MFRHGPLVRRSCSAVRPAVTPPFRASGIPPASSLPASRHGSLLPAPVSFHSDPPAPPAGPCGGTLFRAYRARAGAPVSAGAVRAPDCACVREPGAGRTSPVGFSGIFSRRRRRERQSGFRITAPSGSIWLWLTWSQAELGIIIPFFEQTALPTTQPGEANLFTVPSIAGPALRLASSNS